MATFWENFKNILPSLISGGTALAGGILGAGAIQGATEVQSAAGLEAARLQGQTAAAALALNRDIYNQTIALAWPQFVTSTAAYSKLAKGSGINVPRGTFDVPEKPPTLPPISGFTPPVTEKSPASSSNLSGAILSAPGPSGSAGTIIERGVTGAGLGGIAGSLAGGALVGTGTGAIAGIPAGPLGMAVGAGIGALTGLIGRGRKEADQIVPYQNALTQEFATAVNDVQAKGAAGTLTQKDWQDWITRLEPLYNEFQGLIQKFGRAGPGAGQSTAYMGNMLNEWKQYAANAPTAANLAPEGGRRYGGPVEGMRSGGFARPGAYIVGEGGKGAKPEVLLMAPGSEGYVYPNSVYKEIIEREKGGSVSGDKWIQGAVVHPGAFTAQAKMAGMGVQEFADYVLSHKDKFDSMTVHRASLARRFNAMANRGHGGPVGGPEKVGYVMGEFKRGKLRSSSGQKVKSRQQAIAIAMSEAGMAHRATGGAVSGLPTVTDWGDPEQLKAYYAALNQQIQPGGSLYDQYKDIYTNPAYYPGGKAPGLNPDGSVPLAPFVGEFAALANPGKANLATLPQATNPNPFGYAPVGSEPRAVSSVTPLGPFTPPANLQSTQSSFGLTNPQQSVVPGQAQLASLVTDLVPPPKPQYATLTKLGVTPQPTPTDQRNKMIEQWGWKQNQFGQWANANGDLGHWTSGGQFINDTKNKIFDPNTGKLTDVATGSNLPGNPYANMGKTIPTGTGTPGATFGDWQWDENGWWWNPVSGLKYDPKTDMLSDPNDPSKGEWSRYEPTAGEFLQPWSGQFSFDPRQSGFQAFNTSFAFNPEAEGYQPFSKPFQFDTADLYKDPGYAFRLSEGEKAIGRSQAAKGMLESGPTLKSLERWAQGLAAQEFPAAYGRALGEYNLGQGQTTAAYERALNQFGLQYGQSGEAYNRAVAEYNRTYNEFQQNQLNRRNWLSAMAGVAAPSGGA